MSSLHGIKALLISDDGAVVGTFRRLADATGIDLRVTQWCEGIPRAISDGKPDVIFAQLDDVSYLSRFDTRGTAVLTRTPPTAVFNREASIPEAVEAVRAGADEYLPELPQKAQGFRRVVAGLLRSQNGAAGPGLIRSGCAPFEGFYTCDRQVLSVCRTLRKVANSDAVVLMEGERGTGKNLLARKMHQCSFRCLGPFMEITLPHTSPGLHVEKNPAGTSAEGLANGTIYFDLREQPSLDQVRSLFGQVGRWKGQSRFKAGGGLRVVVGAAEAQWADYLDILYEEGLGGSVDPIKVEMPPLRERAGDISLLTRAYLWRLRARNLSQVTRVEEAAFRSLIGYGWPRNVEGLKKALEHGTAEAGNERTLRRSHLPGRVRKSDQLQQGRSGSDGRSLAKALHAPEKRIIQRALRQKGGNKRATAKKLGISRSTLYKKLKKYGLDNGRHSVEPDEHVGSVGVRAMKSPDKTGCRECSGEAAFD